MSDDLINEAEAVSAFDSTEKGLVVASAMIAEITRLRAQVERVGRDQIEARVEAVVRRNFVAPEDPAVEILCLRYGYGAVMDAASRLWARRDLLGAFYIGGCIGFRTEEEARAALATYQQKQEGGGMNAPSEPGGFVGDIYYGDPDHTTLGTHRWNGSEWMPLPTEAEALMTLLGSARAEITRLRAMVEAADGLADVVAGLTKQARVACKLGATIGPHWTHLGLAQMMTDAALATYQQKREGGE